MTLGQGASPVPTAQWPPSIHRKLGPDRFSGQLSGRFNGRNVLSRMHARHLPIHNCTQCRPAPGSGARRPFALSPARPSTADPKVPHPAPGSAVGTGGGQPSELEERILNALEILAVKLERGVVDVLPIFERLEQELEQERSRSDAMRRASSFLEARRKSRDSRHRPGAKPCFDHNATDSTAACRISSPPPVP